MYRAVSAPLAGSRHGLAAICVAQEILLHSPLLVRTFAKKNKKHKKSKGSAKAKQEQRAEAAASTSGSAKRDSVDDGLDFGSMQASMGRIITHLGHDFKAMRSGRADVAMLDHVMVEVYGTPQPLNAVGQVKLNSPTLLSVQVYDAGVTCDVEKSIRECGMELNPSSDGNVVQVPVPRATAESREALVKLAGKTAEASKAHARGLRKKYMSKLKIPPPEGMSEDEVHKLRKRVQAITDDCVKRVDDLLEKKQAAIRQV